MKIVDNLPYYGYQNNDAVNWLLSGVDEELSRLVETANQYVSGVSVSGPGYGDAARYLGFVSLGFWDDEWSDSTKQSVLENTEILLGQLGTKKSVETALSTVYAEFVRLDAGEGLSLLDTEVGEFLGAPTPFFYLIRVTDGSSRDTWKSIYNTARLFTPAYTDMDVSFETAQLGIARVGDYL